MVKPLEIIFILRFEMWIEFHFISKQHEHRKKAWGHGPRTGQRPVRGRRLGLCLGWYMWVASHSLFICKSFAHLKWMAFHLCDRHTFPNVCKPNYWWECSSHNKVHLGLGWNSFKLSLWPTTYTCILGCSLCITHFHMCFPVQICSSTRLGSIC